MAIFIKLIILLSIGIGSVSFSSTGKRTLGNYLTYFRLLNSSKTYQQDRENLYTLLEKEYSNAQLLDLFISNSKHKAYDNYYINFHDLIVDYFQFQAVKGKIGPLKSIVLHFQAQLYIINSNQCYCQFIELLASSLKQVSEQKFWNNPAVHLRNLGYHKNYQTFYTTAIRHAFPSSYHHYSNVSKILSIIKGESF